MVIEDPSLEVDHDGTNKRQGMGISDLHINVDENR